MSFECAHLFAGVYNKLGESLEPKKEKNFEKIDGKALKVLH